MLISGICGSLRTQSWNKLLLACFLQKISVNSDHKTEIIDISQIPLFNADIETKRFPESVILAKNKISNSDLLIFSSPAYNASISGVMKNTIDWISRPPKVLEGKYGLVIGATPGMSGTLLGYSHLNHILLNLGMNVLNEPRLLVSRINKQMKSSGNVISNELEELINTSTNQLLDGLKFFFKPQS